MIKDLTQLNLLPSCQPLTTEDCQDHVSAKWAFRNGSRHPISALMPNAVKSKSMLKEGSIKGFALNQKSPFRNLTEDNMIETSNPSPKHK